MYLPQCRIYAPVNWDSIVSGNGLLPVRCLAIIWTITDILSICPLGTNFSEIFKIQKFLIHKNAFENVVCKWRPFCSWRNELMLFMIASLVLGQWYDCASVHEVILNEIVRLVTTTNHNATGTMPISACFYNIFDYLVIRYITPELANMVIFMQCSYLRCSVHWLFQWPHANES